MSIVAAACALVWSVAAPVAQETAMVFPGAAWAAATPESQGVDAAKLTAALDYLHRNSGRDGVDQVAVVRHGYLIWTGAKPDERHGVWSLTKSFTSTCLGLLIDDGRCGLETTAKEVVPELGAVFGGITLRHFTTMTSGYQATHDEPAGSYRHGPSPTWYEPGAAPLFAPGTQYAYWDSAMNELGLVLTRLAGESLRTLLQRRIGDAIGLRPDAWDWGELRRDGGMPVVGGSGNGDRHVRISARELARFGLLFLHRGNWNGRQLISREWVEAATRNQVPTDIPVHERSGADGRGCYGYNWWVNGLNAEGGRKWPGAPPGTFSASGFNNNDLFVVPEWDMVIVRLGLDEGERKITDEVYGTFLRMVGEAASAGGAMSRRPHARP